MDETIGKSMLVDVRYVENRQWKSWGNREEKQWKNIAVLFSTEPSVIFSHPGVIFTSPPV